MTLFRKFFSFILVLLILAIPVQVCAVQEDAEPYIQRMMQYYLLYQSDAQEEIDVLLDHLSVVAPDQADMWRQIMFSWGYINEQMPLNYGILPDGLPQDDSLCIVIMGYGLKPDGSMREELIDRLVVGLSSALKYPNAYVAVTGGETSNVEGITEAGQMAQWLRERGVEENRLIVENKAWSTIENAKRVYKLLANHYPQVKNLAVITSDYHIKQSCTLFAATASVFANAWGTDPVQLVSNAVNQTEKTWRDLSTQASGIAALTGVPFDAAPETEPELS